MKRKQNDPRQLPLPSPKGDISPELVMSLVEIPPPITAQPDLIRLLQKILAVKLPTHSVRTALELNPDFFDWPTTDAPAGNGHVTKADWPERGLLGYFGYVVGVNGKLRLHRQTILARLFELNAVPNLVSPDYVLEWGASRSAARLKKMAYSIAAFCRNAKRRQRAIMNRAIANYTDDLDWLKKKYYDGRFDRKFRWPKT